MHALRLSAALLASSLLGIAGPSTAQTRHDSAAPIDFGADHIELQDKANRAILSGGVTVRQAEMTLSAARMTVAYTGQVVDGSPQVSRLDASGGVTVSRPDQSARSQYAVYDLKRREVIMLGNVMLVQGGNPVNGGRLRIDLDTGKAYLDGGAAVAGQAGSVSGSGGRVTGRFSVPKRDK
ncbi:LptA/OstA family protein [Sphingomonas sp. 28-63-12]|uniref:LptA/OstA family protein n=1 Tax=Sphingomonas sp. 28-63-12 TaxID=1970434 RepID=UPI000BD2E0FF|nr:MAG: OstA family protein [Sphingomonas sp. 28-63-12]